MKMLNLSEAKKIALKISKDITPIDHREFFLVHSEKVGKVAILIAKKLNLDEDIFETAGWVHDIGYAKDFENHAEYAIPILEEAGYEVDDILRDCILNHGGSKEPKTLQGKIFQIADKLSIFDADIIEITLKHGSFPFEEDDAKFLKMMSDKAFLLLNKFKM